MVLLLAILVLAPNQAEAKQKVSTNSAPTTLFDGNTQSVKPAQIGDLTSELDGGGNPVYISGRSVNLKDGVGPIKWTTWKKKKAVGRGRGWTTTCAATCPFVNPWNGTKLRVSASGKKGGKFRRLKVFQWTRWMNVNTSMRENYTMKLKLVKGQWSVTSIDNGKS